MAKSGTPAQVKAKFATFGVYNWYGKCAAVVHTVCRHFGEVGKDTPYPSAKAAYNATRIESKDPKKAPAGAVHYWSYYGRNSRLEMGDWGHTGVDMTGGGRDILNATSYPNERYGKNVGTSTFAEINGRVGKYLGWSKTYGRSYTANIVAPAAPKPDPAGKPAASSYGISQVTTAAVRLRAKPTTESATLTVIPAAKVVATGPAKGGWHPVKYGTRTGWVRADFLIARTKKVHAADGLRLRQSASTTSKTLTVLKNGTKVTVLATLGKNDNSPWVKVRVGVRTGWVASRFLR